MLLKSTKTPVVLQSEATECALACLAMILGTYGAKFSLADLRSRFSTSARGTTVKSLMEMARSLGLVARPLRAELDYLKEMVLPAVIHWGLSHYVVLVSVSGEYATIHDPAIGRRKVDARKLAECFSGVAIEFTPLPTFQRKVEKRKFGWTQFLGVLRQAKGLIWISLAVSICFEILQLIGPFYLQWTVDWIISSGDTEIGTTLLIGFLGVLFISVIASAVRSWIAIRMGSILNGTWLIGVFEHAMRLPLSFFERRFLGDIVSRFEGISQIQRVMTSASLELGFDVLMSVLLIALMCSYDVLLATLPLLSLSVTLLLRLIKSHDLRSALQAYEIESAVQRGFFLETVTAIQGIKSFCMEGARSATWFNLVVRTQNAINTAEGARLLFRSSNTLIFGLERLALIWIASEYVIAGDMSLGMMFAFVAYRELFIGRVTTVLDRALDLNTIGVQLDRLADIVLAAPEEQGETCGDREKVRSIELEDVWFRYSDNDPYVLRGISFKVSVGECLAITGKSGCGKSTLMKVMQGMLIPTKGIVKVNGIPLAAYGLSCFRRLSASVFQNDELLSGTLAENIAFFDQPFDLARVEECAKMAVIHDEISSMPMSYNSIVTDMGSTLSGGQKQRLLIARALYKRPQVIFLDEATNHLDQESERAINSVMRELPITRILVAHRTESIRLATRVLSIEGGLVVDDILSNG
ncbi:MAG: peptidase domain-containing ABC transporter [Chloroflexi bacterium]|nr:peptidase domain-containing ABC transporter [Chloroflexota bacterium]